MFSCEDKVIIKICLSYVLSFAYDEQSLSIKGVLTCETDDRVP